MVNFIDDRKTFDSVHRPALWKILKLYGLPMKVIAIIQRLKLYEESYCSVRIDGDTSSWLRVVTGVRQGCILSPLLFAIAIDWVLHKTTDNSTGGIVWEGQEHLSDLDFADVIASPTLGPVCSRPLQL